MLAQKIANYPPQFSFQYITIFFFFFSFTESSIEPMKNQLLQINANIKEYNEMIDASRAKILQNTEKIFKLLTDQQRNYTETILEEGRIIDQVRREAIHKNSAFMNKFNNNRKKKRYVFKVQKKIFFKQINTLSEETR